MKINRVLKMISYLSIPILIGIIILSFVYETCKEDVEYLNNYFETEEFVGYYINDLISNTEKLVLKEDNDIIEYDEQTKTNISYISPNNKRIKDYYFLIIMENLAITNVPLTKETSSINEIKSYINNNENSKKVTIIEGNLETDSEVMKNKAIKYLKQNGYYHEDTNTSTVYTYAYSIKEPQIYSSYKEEINLEPSEKLVRKIFDYLTLLEGHTNILLPTSVILLIVICIYLIIAIDNNLNDFDKIPFEILFFVATMIFGIVLIILENLEGIFNIYNTDFVLTIIITTYLGAYTILAILANTIIKRIKAKKFMDSFLIYRIIKKVCKTFGEYTSTTVKLITFALLYIVTMIVLLNLFGAFGLFLDIIITIYVLYKIISKINGMKNEAIQKGIQSERLKTELITNVSHDIKTPLTSIINYIDLLKQENIENTKAKEYIGILENKSQRLKKLTEDLVEASKASSGNIKLNIEKINLDELMNQSIGEFEDKFKSKGLNIIKNTEDKNICINADNRYMYRIIENLFVNITKYALENSRVYIDITNLQNKKVKIEIKNISKEKLNISTDELMQRFVRGDKSRTTEGSGLGLSISKSLTELQKGSFNINIDGDLFKVELIFEIE